MYMNMEEIHKAQNKIDTAWDIYYEVWKDEPELLEAKYTGFQPSALKTLLTGARMDKL